MPRYIFPLILILYSCTPSELPPGDYYGALQIEDYTFRLIFSNKEEKPSLLVVGFRGNEIPINEVSFKNDTLRFSRADMFTTYQGRYVANTGNITGLWKGEDSIAHPLTFVPALSDTIVGVNPRTSFAFVAIKVFFQQSGRNFRQIFRLSKVVLQPEAAPPANDDSPFTPPRESKRLGLPADVIQDTVPCGRPPGDRFNSIFPGRSTLQ